MKYWFDTEFIEDGKTIDLLSIGIVSEDGRELYLENNQADLSRASAWVREHVFSNMLWTPDVHTHWIAPPVQAFCDPEKYGKPEFWAYYADYDWVAMCQLFGRMVDLPSGWPMYCHDFKQWLDSHYMNAELRKLTEDAAHNALRDAQWLTREYARLTKLHRQQQGLDQ